jgi:hypothetical protein
MVLRVREEVMHLHNLLLLNIISHFSHHNKLGVSFNLTLPMIVDLLCTVKKNPMIFLRTAYKLYPDYNGAILGKVWFIFGQIWYISTFHISAVRFSVRNDYPFVGKKSAAAPSTQMLHLIL